MGRMLGYAYMLISASSARGASLFCMGARHHELYGYGSGVQSHRQPRDDRAEALLALSPEHRLHFASLSRLGFRRK